jgi:phosphoenolpyruvate-protein kinase (PTS system EI component)
MTPGAIEVAKQTLGDVRAEDLRALARRVLRLATVGEIEQALEAVLGRLSGTRE